MQIPEDKLQEVRDATDILDVVSEYVRLKKGGSNFFGLCPFHSEKTPSFSVNPGKGIYKCFGCGEGGDAIGFVMRVEHVSFVDAVRHLAERAGIELPREGEDEAAPSTKRRPFCAHSVCRQILSRASDDIPKGRPRWIICSAGP
jgi:DNA primase